MTYSRARVWQLVFLVTLTAWYIKFTTLVYAYNGHIGLPFKQHELLSGWMLSPHVSLLTYMTPLLGVIALVYPRRKWFILASVVLMTSSLLMLWNIHSYNDATFVVIFWISAWLLWWAITIPCQGREHALWAVRLGLGIVGLMFLGGAAGKWTDSYWSGEAVYQLYFMQKDLLVYSWMRERLDQEMLHFIACWFSRVLVITESLWATVFLWPGRLASLSTMILSVIMIAGSTWMLFSVLGGIIGLCLGILVIYQHELGKISA
ncbi:MAG: hypothetical protein AAF649_07790 [Verrucomicrobiota bacterium]